MRTVRAKSDTASPPQTFQNYDWGGGGECTVTLCQKRDDIHYFSNHSLCRGKCNPAYTLINRTAAPCITCISKKTNQSQIYLFLTALPCVDKKL